MVEGKQEVLFNADNFTEKKSKKLFHTVLAGAVCKECFEVVEVHPLNYKYGDENASPYLRVLCDGMLVDLRTSNEKINFTQTSQTSDN